MKKIEKVIVDKKEFNKLFLGEDGKSLKKSKKKRKWDDDKLYLLKKTKCVQCGKELNAILELEKWIIPVCTEPSCPNFGLLQIGVKKMYEFINNNNNDEK